MFQIQVSGRLSELKTTVDVGLSHRGRLLETIGEHFEQWNSLVGLEFFYLMKFINYIRGDITKTNSKYVVIVYIAKNQAIDIFSLCS